MTDTVIPEADSPLPELPRPTVLVVDDRPENLRVLELILAPLDVDVICAASGEEALRVLLEHDVAVIVLDVRMPIMDGFETATYIKRRERTRHVPIIFLTAMGNDREQALSGYQAGAVDFIEKPVEPLVLCAKVATFAELYASRMQVARQAEQLRRAEAREAARAIAEVRDRGERRYRELAEAMPSMVFALDPDGTVTYRSPSWDEYTGGAIMDSVAAADTRAWTIVHPSERAMAQRAWGEVLADPDGLGDGRFELKVRLQRHDGVWKWHDIHCVPRRDDHGRCTGWVGTATEVDTTRRNETAQAVLSEAGAILVASSDAAVAVTRVAEVVVPAIADWCSVDVTGGSGSRRLAMRVDGDLMPPDVERLGALLSTSPDAAPMSLLHGSDTRQRVLLDGDGTVLGAEDEEQAVAVLVPLVVRGERIGVLSLAVAGAGRCLGPPETTFARALASRLASALDATRLLRRAEERAQAAQVLDAIADGVALVDRAGVVRLWNPAAASIVGVGAEEIVGRLAVEVLPGWESLVSRVAIDVAGATRPTVATAPFTTPGGREIWLSMSAVGFELGTAYAFRDLTEERAVERMKSDFVATVSHELRTPLASIYGAAVTLQRDDVELDPEVHSQLLDIIGQQSQQLASIVDAVLTASRLDAGDQTIATKPVDALGIAREVVDAARSRVDERHDIQLEAAEELPHVAADPSHLRQVLDNLVENAIKYSPDGGAVVLALESRDGTLTCEVRDDGLGIPRSEQRRIFEKFYRVDADMTTGIGGTGLGLFIVRELVRRMDGRIDVRSRQGAGSTFAVTLPVAQAARPGG